MEPVCLTSSCHMSRHVERDSVIVASETPGGLVHTESDSLLGEALGYIFPRRVDIHSCSLQGRMLSTATFGPRKAHGRLVEGRHDRSGDAPTDGTNDDMWTNQDPDRWHRLIADYHSLD